MGLAAIVDAAAEFLITPRRRTGTNRQAAVRSHGDEVRVRTDHWQVAHNGTLQDGFVRAQIQRPASGAGVQNKVRLVDIARSGKIQTIEKARIAVAGKQIAAVP